MFEAEFHFNTSQSFAKDLVVIVASLALAYGVAKVWLLKREARNG